jgi:hypothetical protein
MHRLLDPRLILHGLLDLRIVGVIEKPLLNRKFELMNLNFLSFTFKFFRNILKLSTIAWHILLSL